MNVDPGVATDVIDASDDHDAFDLNVTLGFEYGSKSAKIRRETSIYAPGLTTGGYASHAMNVATYASTRAQLVPRLDVGLYKDVAAYFRLPIVLSYTQELTSLDGTQGREGVVLQGTPGSTLFTLPFASPTRSGLDYLATGVDLNVLNQARDPAKPTWLIGGELRFSLGTPMHACNPRASDGQVSCADPGDINRNGQPDGGFEAKDVPAREAGVSRGTTTFEGHTLISHRMRYIEPYGGFSGLFEFQQASSDFARTESPGSLVNHPPFVGTMIFGLMVIPWEDRESFGRLTFDFRFQGEYHSQGRDYSELFDALGSSQDPSLRQPEWSGYQAGSTAAGQPLSVVDETSSKNFFTGITEVSAYGSYRGSAGLTWQAARMFRLQLGMGYRYDQSHVLTGDQHCNPNLSSDVSTSGPCKLVTQTGTGQTVTTPTGVPNPNFRPVLNAPGRRFFVEDSGTLDVFSSATLMF